MLNQLLQKIIKASTGRSRFILAGIGLSVALILILSAVQLQANYTELLHGKTNQDSVANFLLINKEVNEQTIGATTLSEAEIEDLRRQPFADAAGVLTPSRFKVSAQSVSASIPFYTDLFFESVPNEFLDVHNKDWTWDDNSTFIPLVVSNMILDMYNFGFATSQGLPQLSQDLVKNLPIKIVIQSPQGPVEYFGKVVGFSDRISSVLVPQQFMDWANKKYGSSQQSKPSRVVIKTRDSGNPDLLNYLKAHGLTTDTDKTRFSRYRKIVDLVVNISWVTGAIMLLFALLIFTLFIQLTIASCKDEIALLITLGAAPRQLQKFLFKQFFPVNIFITLAVLAVIAVLQVLLQQFLVTQSIHVPALISWFTIAAALFILLVLWLVNNGTIKKYIRQNQ